MFRNLLRSKYRSENNSNHQRLQARRRKNMGFETLEERTVLTATLYLDFGDNFPVGGLAMSVDELRGTFGANGIQGPNLIGVEDVGQPAIVGATPLLFQGLSTITTIDYNGVGGVGDAADYTDLRSDIVSLVQRYYSVFDVNVVIAPALDSSSSVNYRAGIITTLQAGANTDGERDVWQFVSFVTRTDGVNAGISIGVSSSLNGIAAGADIGGNNARDDSAVAFADVVLSDSSPVSEAAIRLAYTAAHEAAHTFGLEHTTEVPFPNNQLSDSDLIVASANAINRENFTFFTRYPLVTSNPPPPEVNNFLRLANNNNLGLKAGAPAYVTGTGADDIITITRLNATQASVTVQAFQRGTNYGTAIDVPGEAVGDSIFSYTIVYTNGVLVQGGFGADRFVIDATIANNFTVRGMSDFADEIIVSGSNSFGSYTPAAATTKGLDGLTYNSGQILVTSGATINFEEFVSLGSITFQNFVTTTFVSPGGADLLNLSVSGGNPQLAGTVNGGTNFLPLRLDTVNRLVINAGAGADSLALNLSAGNPIPAGNVRFIGDGGVDTISVIRNTNFALSDTALAIASFGIVELDAVEIANLTGGSDANEFTVTTWTGTANIIGAFGDDTLNVTKNNNFVASDGVVTTNDGMQINFSGIEAVNLTGGNSANRFEITPSPTVPFNIVGGLPTASPGDIFRYNGNDPNLIVLGVGSGRVTSLGKADVEYSGIEEALEFPGSITLTVDANIVLLPGNVKNDGITDTFVVVPDADPTLQVITINGKDFAKIGTTSHLTILGSNDIDLVTFRGTLATLIVDTGKNNDSVNVAATALLETLDIKTGDGNDYVELGASVADPNNNSTAAAGFNFIAANGLTVTGNLSVDAGAGDDNVYERLTIVNGSKTVVLGSGNDRYDAYAALAGPTTIDGDAGNDTFQVGFMIATDTVNMTSGDGLDLISVFISSFANNVSFVSGIDRDTVALDVNSYGRNVSVDTGAEADYLLFSRSTGFAVPGDGTHAQLSTGEGTDEIIIGGYISGLNAQGQAVYASGVNIIDRITLDAGTGVDKVRITGNIVRQFFADLGDGRDEAVVEYNTLAEYSLIDGGLSGMKLSQKNNSSNLKFANIV